MIAAAAMSVMNMMIFPHRLFYFLHSSRTSRKRLAVGGTHVLADVMHIGHGVQSSQENSQALPRD